MFLKIPRFASLVAVTIFLTACGNAENTLDGIAAKPSTTNSTQAMSVDELPQIQMQDASGANITGFDYDSHAEAALVTEQLTKAAAGKNTQTPQPARAAGFIIKYNTDVPTHSLSQASVELTKPTANSISVVQTVSSAAGINLNYGIRLAVGSHTYRSDKFISQAEALTLAAAIKQADPSIKSITPDYVNTTNFLPNDPLFGSQWNYQNSPRNGGSYYGINLPSAWNISIGSGAKVAVIDTGYTNHPDLLSNTLPGYDFISDTYIANDGNGRDADATDPGDGVTSYVYCDTDNSSWHGTHVAGTVAATTNNNVGVAGVAFGAKIVPVRVLGRCGGYDSDISDGIIWAAGGYVPLAPINANPVHVINLSLGGQHACTQSMQDAIDFAVKQNVTVVVAAGNSATNVSSHSPANCNNVIAVAATDRYGYRSYFSNYGAGIDTAAPGSSILSTINLGTQALAAHDYTYYQGTSMAAPHVAGVAALLKTQKPSRNHFDIEHLIKRTALPLGSKCSSCGTGLVDPYAAMLYTDPSAPVFRLNNKSLSGAYLFTAYASERDSAFAYYNFGVEGVAFHVSHSAAVGLSPVIRFRNKVTGAFLYSIYESEIASLRTTYANSYTEEGVAWHASKSPRPGWTPLYRFGNKLNGTYTFTAYESERNAMNTTYSAIFQEEGIGFYVIP